MTKDEIEFEILYILCTTRNIEFESYNDFLEQFGTHFLCPRNDVNDVLTKFEKSDFFDFNANGKFTLSNKARDAYVNHRLGRTKRKTKELFEYDKLKNEVGFLSFRNSKLYKILTILSLVIGIVGGILGFIAFNSKNDSEQTKKLIETYVNDSYHPRQQKEFEHYTDSTQIELLDMVYSDTNINNSRR